MKKFIIACVAISILAGAAYTVWRTHNGSTDFDTYYYAAKRILDSKPLYQDVKDFSPYIYPPFFACALIPLVLTSLETAAFLWYLFNIAVVFLSLRLISWLVFGDGDLAKNLSGVRFLPKAIVLGVTIAVFLDNISLLQVNIMIFAAVAAGLYLFSRGRYVASAAAIGFAVSVKVIPAVFILYFIVKRQFRLAALALAFVAVFSIVVPLVSLEPSQAKDAFTWWLNDNLIRSTGAPNFQMMDSMFNPKNQSVTAILSRWLVANDGTVMYWKTVSHNYPKFIHNMNLGLTSLAAVNIAKALVGIMVLVTLFSCALPARKARQDRREEAACEYALVMLLALLTTPILKTQYFVFALPALYLSAVRPHGRIPYVGLVFLMLYALQAVEFFGIVGLGGAGIIFLWAVFLKKRLAGSGN